MKHFGHFTVRHTREMQVAEDSPTLLPDEVEDAAADSLELSHLGGLPGGQEAVGAEAVVALSAFAGLGLAEIVQEIAAAALGGVEVEVTQKEADFINDTTSQTVSAGVTKLNGDEALVYCRIRYLDSDFMRTQRQRKVMSAIVDKVKHAGPVTDYKLAEVILPQVKTDITKGEMLGIGLGALGYLSYDVEQLRIPVDDSYTSRYFGAQEALSIDFDRNKSELRTFIYGE